MKVNFTPPPNIVAHDPKNPVSIEFIAEKPDEHTLILALIAASSGKHPGVLNRAFNRIAREVVGWERPSSIKRDGRKPAQQPEHPEYD